jgi:hypothetical protein
MVKNTDEKNKIDVTCPRCRKVRRVSRYSVAGAWQTDQSADSVEFSYEARTCRTCTLRVTATKLRARVYEIESEITKLESEGL